MSKKIKNNEINIKKMIKDLNKYSDNKEYDKLSKTFVMIIEYLEDSGVFLPDLIKYYITYYMDKYNFKTECRDFIKYFAKIPVEYWKKEHLTSIRILFAEFRYEELVTDLEYISYANIIYNITKPEQENHIVINNNHMFKELRVGFISSDFSPHPVGRFILALLKNKLNYQTINYFAYDTIGQNNPIQNAIKENTYKFCNVSKLEDKMIVNTILEDKLDILIDLDGCGKNTKIDIITPRLAPIQMSYIGFPGTTGYYNVDYTIVDKVTDPIEYSQMYYTEKLLYVDKTFLCYACEPSENIISYESPFYKNKYITIGSFANPKKYSDKLLRLWKKVVDCIPDCRFYIQSFFFNNEDDIEHQKKRFQSFGIDISKVDFYKRDQFADYFKNYNKVDLILDTFPFNGATTTCDAFSMSVPVVTLAGHTHVSRVTASMLINMNLPELIAYEEDEYIKKIIDLTLDKERLISLRRIIRERFMNSALTDTVSFKIELERKFRDVYIKHIVNNKDERVQDNPNIIISAKEALTSIIYIQDMISEPESYNIKILPEILKEASLVHLELCNYLYEAYSGDKNALKMLKQYNDLSILLSKNIDKNTLNTIIVSIRKIISMFIS